jgi:hypothetical protein
VGAGGRKTAVDAEALNTTMVLENDVVFGSVNAARRHYELAATALGHADRRWLERLITRRVPLGEATDLLDRGGDDIKAVIEFEPAAVPSGPAPAS